MTLKVIPLYRYTCHTNVADWHQPKWKKKMFNVCLKLQSKLLMTCDYYLKRRKRWKSDILANIEKFAHSHQTLKCLSSKRGKIESFFCVFTLILPFFITDSHAHVCSDIINHIMKRRVEWQVHRWWCLFIYIYSEHQVRLSCTFVYSSSLFSTKCWSISQSVAIDEW